MSETLTPLFITSTILHLDTDQMPPRKKVKIAHDDAEPAPRRSSRAKAVKHEPPVKSSETPEPLTKAVAARRRPDDRHLRVPRGGLADMPNMPLDVLVEVRDKVYCTQRSMLMVRRSSLSSTRGIYFVSLEPVATSEHSS